MLGLDPCTKVLVLVANVDTIGPTVVIPLKHVSGGMNAFFHATCSFAYNVPQEFRLISIEIDLKATLGCSRCEGLRN